MTQTAPQAARRPGENGFKYKQQYGLIVVCKDEAEQQQRFAQLKALGIKAKVVCV